MCAHCNRAMSAQCVFTFRFSLSTYPLGRRTPLFWWIFKSKHPRSSGNQAFPRPYDLNMAFFPRAHKSHLVRWLKLDGMQRRGHWGFGPQKKRLRSNRWPKRLDGNNEDWDSGFCSEGRFPITRFIAINHFWLASHSLVSITLKNRIELLVITSLNGFYHLFQTDFRGFWDLGLA